MKHAHGIIAAAAALLAAASCATAPGEMARFGEKKHFQLVEFQRIFNTKAKLADLVVTTGDLREPKDLQEWCSIFNFEEGKYVKFEYQKDRKYHYGTDRRRHNATFMWPVDYFDDPENRCMLLLEVSSEYAVQGENVSYKGQGYEEEIADLRTAAFFVRRTKEGFSRDAARDPEVLKALDIIVKTAVSEGREADAADLPQLEYLRFTAASALLRLAKAVDAAVDLQKIISRIETAAAAKGSGQAQGRCDLMNLDYLRVACKRLIEEIKQGKFDEKAGKNDQAGQPDKTDKAGWKEGQ